MSKRALKETSLGRSEHRVLGHRPRYSGVLLFLLQSAWTPLGSGQMAVLGRRDFLFALAGTTVAWPRAAHAQQPATPVIGFLSPGSPKSDGVRLTGVRQGLKEFGYVEGQNARFGVNPSTVQRIGRPFDGVSEAA